MKMRVGECEDAKTEAQKKQNKPDKNEVRESVRANLMKVKCGKK